MDNSASRKQAIVKAAVVAVGQKARGLNMASGPSDEQIGPDRDSVVDIVRHKVGSVLDDLADAREKVQAARRLQETAKAVGDHQVESMIAGELQALLAEVRLAS